MIWYIENLLRSRHERLSLEALVSTVDWLVPVEWRIDRHMRLTWDVDILTNRRTFSVSLCYPNHFPYSPPIVTPRNEEECWSFHQWGANGELCLEIGPDNWHQNITGADMIQSAYRLLQGEQLAPGELRHVASRHVSTLGQDLRNKIGRFLVTRNLSEVIRAIPNKTCLEGNLTGIYNICSIVYVIKSIKMQENEEWVDAIVPKHFLNEKPSWSVSLFRWPLDSDLPSTESLQEFQDAVVAGGIELPNVEIVLLAQGSTMFAYHLWTKENAITSIPIIPPEPTAVRLDENHRALETRKVGIVGCGSLGSKVATILARSGVGRFLLIDDDIMLPDNFVRHDLDWCSVGMHKADGVARRIRLVNPTAVCNIRKHKLGGQESSGSLESLIEGLAECDLIIDATADANVFNYLCAAIVVGRKPLLWAEVFGGGIGGLIARHRPGYEPDPASMRCIIDNWCMDRGRPFERAMENYEVRGDGPPLIADDADVTVIAAHTARMAIDMLIPSHPSIYPHPAYMVGLKEGWIFDQPFDTHPIDVGSPQLPIHEDSIDKETANDEYARILALFGKGKDADSSDATDSQTLPD